MRPGDELTGRIHVENNLGVPRTGLTFTIGQHVYGIDPNGDTIPTDRYTWSELGLGDYEFRVQTFFPGDDPGLWTVIVDEPAGGFNQSYTLQWELDHRFAIPTMTGISRQTLRRRVLAKFGDLIVLTATENGLTDTFVDRDNLNLEPGAFRAREVIFTAGQTALRGLIRRVQASSQDGASIRFSNPLPVNTVIGDECEMTNAYGVGASISAVHNAIDYAITIGRDYAMVPVVFDIVDAFDGLTGHTFTVPSEIIGVERVMTQATNGEWSDVRRATRGGDEGWSMMRSSRGIAINGRVGYNLHGSQMRVEGYMLPEIPTNDTDEIYMDPEWLILQATAHLCLDVLRSRQASGEWTQRGLQYEAQADAIRSQLTPNIGPSFARF